MLDDFGGNLGRAWRETAEEDANREMLIRDLWTVSIAAQLASSPSIRPRAGRET
jgi:hypothetical protein